MTMKIMAMIMPQHCSPILSGEGKGVGCNEREKASQTEPAPSDVSHIFSNFLLHLSPRGQPYFLLDLYPTLAFCWICLLQVTPGSHVSITGAEWWVAPNDRKYKKRKLR